MIFIDGWGRKFVMVFVVEFINLLEIFKFFVSMMCVLILSINVFDNFLVILEKEEIFIFFVCLLCLEFFVVNV